MNVYMPGSEEDSELCHPVDDSDFEVISDKIRDGNPQARTWTPVRMQIIRKDEGRRLTESDAPWLSNQCLVLRTDAIAAMGTLLAEFGELLPLRCADAQVSMFNPTRVLDALDTERCEILRFNGGDIMSILRYAFRPSVLRGQSIFKLAGLRSSPTLVDDRFVEQWQAAELRGLVFRRIWSDSAWDPRP